MQVLVGDIAEQPIREERAVRGEALFLTLHVVTIEGHALRIETVNVAPSPSELARTVVDSGDADRAAVAA